MVRAGEDDNHDKLFDLNTEEDTGPVFQTKGTTDLVFALFILKLCMQRLQIAKNLGGAGWNERALHTPPPPTFHLA